MEEQETLPKKEVSLARRKGQKFLFDKNDFSPEAIQAALEAEMEPPPPSFSEDEISEAKRTSYAKGKKEGLEEAENGHIRHIDDLVQKITENFSTLFAEEDSRVSLYERETIELFNCVFKKIYPTINEKFGLEEVKKIIEMTLENHRTTPEIIIEVPPEYVKDIQEQMDNAIKNIHSTGECSVKANNSLSAGDCRLTWNSGGTSRDHNAISEQIGKLVQDTLAEKPHVQDNDSDEIRNGDGIVPKTGDEKPIPIVETDNE
jgi:flagellar assembly protein FliH